MFNPPEFCIDPNDDNILIGVPDDPSSLHADDTASAAARGKETEATDQAHQKRDKTKIYENRAKISKSLLGRTGVIKDDLNNDENEVIHFNMIFLFFTAYKVCLFRTNHRKKMPI